MPMARLDYMGNCIRFMWLGMVLRGVSFVGCAFADQDKRHVSRLLIHCKDGNKRSAFMSKLTSTHMLYVRITTASL